MRNTADFSSGIFGESDNLGNLILAIAFGHTNKDLRIIAYVTVITVHGVNGKLTMAPHLEKQN